MTIKYDFPDEREADIEADIWRRARSRGWFVAKLMVCNINGMPDRILHRRGYTIYMEMKKVGEPPTRQQTLRHKELRKAGIPVHVVDTREDAYAILD